MPKVRYLRVGFAQQLRPCDIPKFRAAVIEKTERVASLFHNHLDDQKVIYRYPLIQYKIDHRNACIVCLDTGVDDIHYLLQQRNLDMRIGSQQCTFEVDRIDLYDHEVHIRNRFFDYSIINWLSLNQKHHQRFNELEGDKNAQIKLLESILTGNILSFAKGINWHVEERIEVEISKIKSFKLLSYKEQKMMGANLDFRCNVSLPNRVGLGKGSSVGFGVVKEKNDY